MELRDRESRNHCRNVADVSVLMAKQCGCDPDGIEIVRVSALLYDIGKIGIAETLLQGEIETMQPSERQEYQLHPVRGQTAIDSVEDLRAAGILIRHHHENFDGSGFPDRLAGNSIPLGARILALADTFDRLFSKAQGDNGIEITMKEISHHLESRFDPALFPFFEVAVQAKYRNLSKMDGMIEIELQPGKLRQGMLVTRDVRSGTGLLLLAAGERLDDWNIQALKRYYHLDPPEGGIMALIKK